jgi:uncharacterized protein YjbI with pentapeptide repeats
MDIDDLKADLSAFADDEGDVVIDSDGSFVLIRNDREVSGKVVEKPDGQILVRLGEREMGYRSFLMNELANLGLFAERLVSRRPPVSAFVDGPVEVRRPAEDMETGSALAVLRRECEEAPAFAARISFITADAGHGKTALLREFQHEQAQAFLAGSGSYLLWHLDLQGRQLLRLSEALMGDLGELRIAGLWMPAVIRLMRQRALVLAIDGFDELAAEQGGTDALGALAALVTHLGGRGSVIAAARRTFFDSEDYLRRAGMVGRALQSPCQFNQISLMPWSRKEGVEYLRAVSAGAPSIGDPEETYNEIVDELGGATEHPMLTRPFLLAQVVRALTTYGVGPAAFIHTADDPLSGVAAVVQAFVRREVAEKWKFRETGEPYLTELQHMQLLADVAEEMYRSQKDRLDLDVIETLTTLLLDQWGIETSRKQQILEMVRMHVLLVPPSDGDGRSRGFDHPEFRDYFIAYAIRSHIERVMEGASASALARFLSVAQLSDSTARYVCGMLDRAEGRVRQLVQSLEEVIKREWKPTFLQVNVGTLLPFILSGVTPVERLMFSGQTIYSSLVFERSRLKNVTLSKGSFVNASLAGVDWDNVVLTECNLGEISIDEFSKFHDVHFENCAIEGLRIRSSEEEIREYAPERIWLRLEQAGVSGFRQRTLLDVANLESSETETVRLLRRVLRLFNRTTVVSEDQFQHRFRHDQAAVFDVILPLLERHNILAQRTWKGAGQTRLWGLNERLDDLLAAEGGDGEPKFSAFWAEASGLR